MKEDRITFVQGKVFYIDYFSVYRTDGGWRITAHAKQHPKRVYTNASVSRWISKKRLPHELTHEKACNWFSHLQSVKDLEVIWNGSVVVTAWRDADKAGLLPEGFAKITSKYLTEKYGARWTYTSREAQEEAMQVLKDLPNQLEKIKAL